MARGRKLPREARKAIMQILQQRPQGLETSELVRELEKRFPGRSRKTLYRYLSDANFEQLVYKPAKGVYALSSSLINQSTAPSSTPTPNQAGVKESDFYESFADFLVSELDECTRAIALGGNCFGDKWGTPDVIGIYKLPDNVPVKAAMEIVSAEIKIDREQVITAFGQACAYTIFSHKVYLVLPEKVERADLLRIESLCMRFGIGLIIFDSGNIQRPNFTIRVRASRHEPDYFYVNKYFKQCDKQLEKLFK